MRRLGWLRADVALVDKGDLDHRAGRLLHLLGQLRNLRAILLVGWGDEQGKQMAQCIDRDMHVTALAAPGAVIGGTRATFRARLQRPTIEDRGRRMGRPLGDFAQQHAQIVDDRLKHARLDPALGLLIDRIPGGRSFGIMRHGAPVRTMYRAPFNTSRSGCSRWGASSTIRVR